MTELISTLDTTMLTAMNRFYSFRYLESATRSATYRSSRKVSSIAREIITGNCSSLKGEWNSGEGEEEHSSVTLDTMKLMHHHLVGRHKDHVQWSRDLFTSLTNAPAETKDKWTESDNLLVSACKHLVEDRNYMKAAICLESITSRNMPDPAILKLTQEFYTLAGRPDLLLKSVIRYPSSFHSSDDFRPSVFGMLGAGYSELGLFQEADEIARKSRAISTEVDVNLIAIIIDGHNLSGKSSEVKTVMDEEHAKYQNIGGLSLLQCGNATSKFIRGNVNFAYNELLSIFDVDFSKNTATHADDFVFNNPVLLKSSFLLLQILMNLTDKHNMELDRVAQLMHNQLRMHDRDHRNYVFIHCMLLATQYVALETMNHSRLILNKPVQEQAQSQSLWANMFGSAKRKRKVESSAKPDSNAPPFVREDELARSLEKVDLLIAQLEAKVNFDQVIRPLLPDVNQEEHLSFLYPSNVDAMKSLILPENVGMDLLSIAVLNFAKKNFDMSSKIMAVLYQRNYGDLGLRMALRDIAHQLYIESLLRNNQLHSAKILLVERTILVPNDGQTWRRLAITHELYGEKKQAEEANYTAWQLGIGQGGFGGAE